jgi:hypothetical protein
MLDIVLDEARMLEGGFWGLLPDGRMVNQWTGEIISLMEWLMRGGK